MILILALDAMKAGSTTNNQQCLNKAERVRGGGAGKVRPYFLDGTAR